MRFFIGLRNGLIISLFLWGMIFAIIAIASDIEVNEPQPEITKWKLDTIRILVFTKTAEIWYRKGYMQNEEFIGTNRGHQILFMDRIDNPETPEDESSTEFTDLIQAINAGNNVKQTITNAVKQKLGL